MRTITEGDPLWLRLYRDEGLSQSEVSKRTGTPQTTLSRWLRELGASEPHRRRDQRGALNHSFKGGTSRSTINRITKRICEEGSRPLNVCELCGTVWSGNLDRHHKDHNRSNNSPSNIIIVCPSCHARHHSDERERDTLGRYI